jgi:hypothetical protein
MLAHDLFYTSYRSTLQANFDAMRMSRGFGEDILDNTLRQFAGALILLQDDEHSESWFNIRSAFTIHYFNLFALLANIGTCCYAP